MLTVDSVIKFIESKFEGVNVRAIQNDITMVGPPHIIFGTDGALEALLDGLAEVGLEPQRTKFQALGTTEEALSDKPGWLPAPSLVIDPANGESFRAPGMETCGAPIGERLFEKNWFRKKFRKVTGTMTKKSQPSDILTPTLPSPPPISRCKPLPITFFCDEPAFSHGKSSHGHGWKAAQALPGRLRC